MDVTFVTQKIFFPFQNVIYNLYNVTMDRIVC